MISKKGKKEKVELIKIEENEFIPSERYGHSAVILEDKMYVFGGCNTDGAFLNELYSWDFKSNKWNHLKRGEGENIIWPKGRHFHSAIVYKNKMYIFAGKSNGYMNDLYSYDPRTGIWENKDTAKGELPSRRFGHSTVIHNDCKNLFHFIRIKFTNFTFNI